MTTRSFVFCCCTLAATGSAGQNVGINTTNPVHARLEVSGAVGDAVGMFGNDMFGTTIRANNPGIGFNYYYDGFPHTIKAGFGGLLEMNPGNGDIFIGAFDGNQSATDFGGITGYKDLLRLKQNGQAGIGNPLYFEGRLNIAGSDGIYLYTDNSAGTFGRITADASGNMVINSQSSNTFAFFRKDILLNPYIDATTDQYRGNVGIRTNITSHAIVEVADGVGATVGMFGNNRFGTTINADNPGVGFNYYYNGTARTIKAGYAGLVEMNRFNGDIYIGNFSGNQSGSDFGTISGFQYNLLVKQNGDIGVGTANPTARLHVSGGDVKADGGIYAEETGGLNLVPLGVVEFSFRTSVVGAANLTITNLAGSLATGGHNITITRGADDELTFQLHLDYSKVSPYTTIFCIGSPEFNAGNQAVYRAYSTTQKSAGTARLIVSYTADSFSVLTGGDPNDFWAYGRFIIYGVK